MEIQIGNINIFSGENLAANAVLNISRKYTEIQFLMQ